MDKIIVGSGLGLVALGVGFLAVSPQMFEIREPLILGGLLWSAIGGITVIIGRAIGTKRKQSGAVR